MPTYEYLCTACKNEWEEVQKISEPPLEVCPKCGKSTAKRQISGGSFILKGGGWYSDLYASPKPKSDTSDKAKKESGEGVAKSDGSKESGSKETSTKESSTPKESASKSDSSSSSSGSGSSTPSK
jgi:putative FmdB family regulatory protein